MRDERYNQIISGQRKKRARFIAEIESHCQVFFKKNRILLSCRAIALTNTLKEERKCSVNKVSNFFVKCILLFVLLPLPAFMAIECFAADQDAANRKLTREDVQQIVECSVQNGEAVDLNALENLDADTARVVAETRGKLFLNGLTAVTPEVAEILATHRGWLHLGGLRSISPAVARALSKHQGWLFLNGIQVLKKDVALAILPYRGQLYLDGVETITEDVAEIIAQRRNGVELYGVRNINYPSVAMLRKNSEIILPSKFNRAGWWPF